MIEYSTFGLNVVGLAHNKSKNKVEGVTLFCGVDNTFEMVTGKNADNTLNTVGVKGTLVRVEVHKRIGEHNWVNARLKFVEQEGETEHAPSLQVARLKQALLRRKIVLTAKNSKEEEMTVAENYYVFGARAVYNVTGKCFYVDLDIYSWDKFMDVTRYSRRYNDSKLGAEIMNGTGGIMSRYAGAPSCVVSGMRVLVKEEKTTDETTGEERTTVTEYMLPNVEQYDETDWSLVRRTANSCGEFLYFENGVLNLGLTKVVNDGGEEVVTDVESRSYAAVESLEEETLDDESLASFVAEVAKEEENSFPLDLEEYSKYDSVMVTNGGRVGGYLQASQDTKGDWMALFPPLWSRVFGRLFQSSSLVEFGLSNLTGEMAVRNFANEQSKSFNEKVVDKYNTEWNKPEPNTSSNNNSNSTNSSTSTDYVQGEYEMDYALLKAMRKAERIVRNSQYRITFDSKQVNLKLGDLVTCKGIDVDVTFVVVDVRSQYEITQTTQQAEDGATTVNTEVSVNRMEVTVIPVYDGCPIPLPIEDGGETHGRDGWETHGSASLRGSGVSNGATGFRIRAAEVVVSDDPYRLNMVKVKFYDDSTDKKSEWNNFTRWIKVLTPFASGGESGVYFKLNKGDRVLVAENVVVDAGNKVDSFVIGSYFNDTNKPPYGGRKYPLMIRSNNGHLIAFNDKKEYHRSLLTNFLPCMKFLSFIPGVSSGLSDTTTDKDLAMSLGGIDITDNYGLYSISTSSDQRAISIESPFGTVGISAAMGITVSAPDGNVKIVGKNVDIVAGNNLTLKSGANIDNWFFTSWSEEGENKEHQKSCWLSELKTLADIIPGLFDLPALRFAVEVLFKPVAGTLKVKSGRYLMLEAGDGEASIPRGMNTLAALKTAKGVSDEAGISIGKEIFKATNNLKSWRNSLISFKMSYRSAYWNICQKRAALNRVMSDFKQCWSNENLDVIDKINKWIDGNNDLTIDSIKPLLHETAKGYLEGDGGVGNNAYVKKNVDLIVESFNEILRLKTDITKDDWGKKIIRRFNQDSVNDQLYGFAQSILNTDKANFKYFISDEAGLDALIFKTTDDQNKALQDGYKIFFNNLNENCGNAFESDLDSAEKAWDAKVAEIKPKYDTSTVKAWLDNNLGWALLNKMLPIDTLSSFSWRPEAKGSILMSQNEGTTIKINGQSLEESKSGSVEELKDAMKKTLVQQ